jgi:hypothetical protein
MVTTEGTENTEKDHKQLRYVAARTMPASAAWQHAGPLRESINYHLSTPGRRSLGEGDINSVRNPRGHREHRGSHKERCFGRAQTIGRANGASSWEHIRRGESTSGSCRSVPPNTSDGTHVWATNR